MTVRLEKTIEQLLVWNACTRKPNTAANIYNQVSQWSSQSPDLNLIKMLFWELNKAVRKLLLVNLDDLKEHCKEEKTKFLHNDVGDW